jgi:hypothetical protein
MAYDLPMMLACMHHERKNGMRRIVVTLDLDVDRGLREEKLKQYVADNMLIFKGVFNDDFSAGHSSKQFADAQIGRVQVSVQHILGVSRG